MDNRRNLTIALAAALVLIGFVYRETFLSIVEKWYVDTAFSHGLLIVPISLWLAWQKRAELEAVDWQPSWPGALIVLSITAIWVVARGTGVLVVEQLAAVAMIPAMVLAIAGGRTVWAMAFPLAFLFLAVPFGRGLVPWFMHLTADTASWALQFSGVPIYRSHMYISIPSGTFEVAKACSGLNYVITGLVLGVLYAYLTYRTWSKRLLCVLAFLVVPILANGLRVYITIAVSHLTEMRWGPGTEHVMFGRIFFILVMLVMFWIGRRWHDDQALSSQSATAVPARPMPRRAWAPVPFALLAAVIGPPYLASSVASAGARFGDAQSLVALPEGSGGWQGPIDGAQGWKPLYVDPLAERAGVYRDQAGSSVDVYVGVYGLGATAGGEMISYKNRIFSNEDKILAKESRRTVVLPDRRSYEVRELAVGGGVAERLVWHWFVIGDHDATNEFAVKGLEALAFVTGDLRPEKVITLSTVLDDGAAARLQAFVAAHAGCIASGLDSVACRR